MLARGTIRSRRRRLWARDHRSLQPGLRPRRVGIALLGCCLASLLTAPQTPATTPRSILRDRLCAHLAAGSVDSLRLLMRDERLASQKAIRRLLLDRARQLQRSSEDSAQATLACAGRLATIYAEEFGDSSCLTLTAHHTALAPGLLPAVLEGWQRYAEAQSYYGRSLPDEARALLEEALARASETGDAHLQAYALSLAGSCHWMQGAYEEARETYRAARAEARRARDPIQETRLLRNIALTYQLQHRQAEAIETFHQVLAAAGRSGDRRLHAQAHNDIGIYHLQQGELEAALEKFTCALTLARQESLPDLEGNVRQNLGIARGQQGRYTEALANLQAALLLARDLGKRRQEVGALLNMAGIHAELEDHAQALILLKEALPIAEQLGAADVAAQIRNEIGEVCRQLGRPEETLRYCRQALPLLRSRGILRSQSVALHNIGAALIALGRLEEAERAFREAEALLQRSGDRIGRVSILADLAELEMQRGAFPAAAAELARAQPLADSLAHPLLLGELECLRGRLHARAGEMEEADKRFRHALAHARALRSPNLLWRALGSRGRCRLAAGDPAAAREYLTEAVELVESLRGQLGGETFRLAFLTNKHELYVSLADACHSLARRTDQRPRLYREAFDAAERAHARVLLDLLARPAAGAEKRIDPALARHSRQIRERLAQLQTLLAETLARDTWDGARVDSLEGELGRLCRTYREVRDEICARHPSHGMLIGQRQPLSAGAVRQRVLLPGQVLLEYLSGREQGFIFLLTEDTLQVERLPVGADSLARLVNRYRANLLADRPTAAPSAPEPQPGGDAGNDLVALLWSPIAASVPPEARLLIIPDGPLFGLPFAALPVESAPLVARHAIALAPSASVLDPALTVSAPLDATLLLAVGNPATFRDRALLDDTRRPAEAWRFGALPFAEQEARQVASYFPQARLLTREEATEEAVKALAPQCTHLHFATHGMLDEQEPLLSGLVLAQDDDPAEDGFLQVDEILALSLAADLVVLSACETGRGRISGGEGVLGLSRAFLHAGARALLISLWEVGDRDCVELMDCFYTNCIAAAQAPDLALRRAQLALRRQGVPASVWAAFIPLGRMETPRAAGARPARLGWFPLSATLVLILAAGLGIRQHRRRRRGHSTR
ncbi:MAG: CHAT domain-containing protein [Candidatus Eisenbacteria sp.]|nr:CHAT domain-containing protein [Candidatus Eisenbacteria bacterium]